MFQFEGGITWADLARVRLGRTPHLKHCFFDLAIGAHPQLQLHDVAAGGRSHQASAHVGIILVHGADIARRFVVVDDLLVVTAPGPECGQARRARANSSGEHWTSRLRTDATCFREMSSFFLGIVQRSKLSLSAHHVLSYIWKIHKGRAKRASTPPQLHGLMAELSHAHTK